MDYGLALQQMFPNIDKSQYELMIDAAGNFSITKWNVTGSAKPSLTDLENYWNNNMIPYWKAQKKAQLQQSFEASLLNGFTSKADGTSRIYDIDPISMSKWTGALAVINAGKATSMTVKDFNGNKVTLTSVQFQQMATDGFTFFNAQEQHLWDKEDDVDLAIDVPTINDITW